MSNAIFDWGNGGKPLYNVRSWIIAGGGFPLSSRGGERGERGKGGKVCRLRSAKGERPVLFYHKKKSVSRQHSPHSEKRRKREKGGFRINRYSKKKKGKASSKFLTVDCSKRGKHPEP